MVTVLEKPLVGENSGLGEIDVEDVGEQVLSAVINWKI